MSRQMAFQLTEYRYREVLKKISELWPLKDDKTTIGEWLDAVEPDARKRNEMKAVLIVSVDVHKKGFDPTQVKKLICWRNEKGEPGLVEAEVRGIRVMAEEKV